MQMLAPFNASSSKRTQKIPLPLPHLYQHGAPTRPHLLSGDASCEAARPPTHFREHQLLGKPCPGMCHSVHPESPSKNMMKMFMISMIYNVVV